MPTIVRTSPLPQQVAENFVPPLLDAVLIDYQRNVPAAREPEVLSTMAIIVNKLGGHITAEIPQIFDAVFECTLNMINKVGDLWFYYTMFSTHNYINNFFFRVSKS